MKKSKKALGVLLCVMLVLTSCCFAIVEASAAAGDTVYCQNEKGWSTVYCYMWTDGQGDNAGWPGEAMTDMGDGLWSYDIKGDFNKIIFNGGSDSNKTLDMSYPGNNALYNNSTGKWDTYDPSPLVVKTLSTDLASPQYKGTPITVTATAKSETNATVYYKFSVNGTMVQDFTTSATYVWTPAAAGEYTITVDVKDDAGNTNSKEIKYEVKDDSTEVKPIVKSIFPADGALIKTGNAENIIVTASGGNTGTNLLFYKYVVKDSAGKKLNTPYYTLNSTFSFTPAQDGEYTVEVSVQNSANTTVTKSVKLVATSGEVPVTTAPATAPTTIAPPATEPSTVPPTVPPTVPSTNPIEPTEPVTVPSTVPSTAPSTVPGTQVTLGDVNLDGKVNINDATLVQKAVANMITLTAEQNTAADVNKDTKVNIKDATEIQKKSAGLNVAW